MTREELVGLEGQGSVGQNLTLEAATERGDSLPCSGQKCGPIRRIQSLGSACPSRLQSPAYLPALSFQLPETQHGDDGPRWCPHGNEGGGQSWRPSR